MKPLLHPPSIFLFLVTCIISINIPVSLCADDIHYTTCNSAFSCGSFSNLTYPFWGGDRPEYCGQPNLKLECEDSVPKFSIGSVKYRILRWDNSAHKLTVARDDYWDGLCVNDYENTTGATFDNTLFQYDAGLANLTLLYNCPGCANPGAGFLGSNCGAGNFVYIATEYVPADSCTSVIIPIYEPVTQILNANTVQQVLQNGFGLKCTGNYEECNTCVDSQGACGSNGGGQFNCFCKDGPHTSSCYSKRSLTSGESIKVGVAIGGAAAGVAALVGVLGFVCFMLQRKKKIAAEQSRSKDPFMPPSSGSAVTSTTNMSQSAPSYPSSETDSVQRNFYFGVQVFTHAELEEATNNFHPSRELGEEGFGTVYKGELKDGRVVAVKRHNESNFKRVEQFMNEVEILTRLRHKNVVTLYGCTSRHSRELLLVYEFIPNGTVADHLHGKRANSTLLPWPVRLDIAIETAEALAYLHASDVIHRDVKSSNILLDNNLQVKVAGFGLSRFFPNDVTHVSTAPQGTPGYIDPECYESYQVTDKSDVYSFGVVLVELISSLQAVDVSRYSNDVNLANMAINKIQSQAMHELVDPYLGFEKDYAVRRMTTAVAELAFRCLQQQRDMRPPMDEVLEILKGIKSDELGAPEAE